VRFVAEYRILDWLSVVGRASPELVLNNFDYQKEPTVADNIPPTYLAPYQLRFTAQLGLAITR
jgi:hypothetical protein